VSVFIANPIHRGLRIHAPALSKTEGGDPKALAGWFPDMYRANGNQARPRVPQQELTRTAAGPPVGNPRWQCQRRVKMSRLK
jgi:hypothetical protein